MGPFKNGNILILGQDEFDYLTYNAEKKYYQIIDKSDLEVLEDKLSIISGINQILKF